jgi:hypothetical protein
MMRACISAAAMLALVNGVASAQTVQFRIVQESPANSAPAFAAAGHYLNPPSQSYAVQAMVSGGSGAAGLASFGFTIVISTEPDTSGTLAKLRISDSCGVYYIGPSAENSTVGAGGLARQYSYLAAINSNFNGLINVTSGNFTNTPGQQEIGMINGSAFGSAMLTTPGMDPTGEGNPVTFTAYGQSPHAVPAEGTTAAIPAPLGPTYFAEGQFIDLYRFRYTISTLGTRTLTITLQSYSASIFSQFIYSNGVWGAPQTTVPNSNITVAPLTIAVSTPGGPCCAPDGSCWFVPQVSCPSGANWTSGGACSPSPCPQSGACCQLVGTCSATIQSACPGEGVWSAGGVCSANPCAVVGACCHGATCTLSSAGACTGFYLGNGLPCNPRSRSGSFNACCASDFDNSGVVAVSDIFAFLNAWFAGCP